MDNENSLQKTVEHFLEKLCPDPLGHVTGFDLDEECVEINWLATWNRGGRDSGTIFVDRHEFDLYLKFQHELDKFDEALKLSTCASLRDAEVSHKSL